MHSFTAALGLLLATTLSTSLCAQQSAPMPQPNQAAPVASAERAGPPKLIIAIAVDQLSSDLFTQYRPLFRGGLARLGGGVVFPQGYQAHAATETCPGHSTILTGAHPARSGMIANNWYDLSLTRDDKRVYCSEDPTVAGSSSASGRYAPSAQYLRTPTLGQRMRAADPRTRVVSVAGKDRAAIMMAGADANGTWWLAPTGLASYRGVEQSAGVAQISAAVARVIAAPRAALDLPAACTAQDRAVDIGGGRSVGIGRFARDGGNFRAFLASTEADGTVLAAGAAMRAQLGLGQGPQTDLLILGLSATDYIGHAVGTGGAEMCLHMLALDRELGDFFARMDATGIDYAVVLTADHGGHDTPERNRENAIPSAERVDAALAPEAIGAAIAADLGLGATAPLLYADAPMGDFYVSRVLSARDRARVVEAAVRRIGAHRQVERVFTAAELAALPMPHRSPETWSVADRLRANFDPTRSGDFIVVLKDRVTPIPEAGVGYIATHGSVWDYDRRVPMLFWRAGMTPFEQPNPVMVVDILPTLAGLIGLPIAPAEIDGRCLDLIAGPGSSCPAQ
jgi:phosphonoacetate hydrolase